MADWTPDAPLVVGDLMLEVFCILIGYYEGRYERPQAADAVHAWVQWRIWGGEPTFGHLLAIADCQPGPLPTDPAALPAARRACLRAAEKILQRRQDEATAGLAEVRRRMRAEGTAARRLEECLFYEAGHGVATEIMP